MNDHYQNFTFVNLFTTYTKLEQSILIATLHDVQVTTAYLLYMEHQM